MPTTHLLSAALWMADTGQYKNPNALHADLKRQFNQRHLALVFEADDIRDCLKQRCHNAQARRRHI